MKVSLISDAMASLIEIQASTLTRCYLNSFVMERPRLLETGSFAVTDRSSDTAISIGLRWRAQGWICISNRSDWNWNISHFVDNGDVFTLWRLDRVVRPTPFHLKCEKRRLFCQPDESAGPFGAISWGQRDQWISISIFPWSRAFFKQIVHHKKMK